MTRTSRSLLAVLVTVAGLAVHQGLLRLTDTHVFSYPHLADPVLSRLPTLGIDRAGEVALAAILGVFSFYHFRRQPERTPLLFVAIGVLFALRGVFLWLMPIGAPPGAPPGALHVYPYSGHNYFPSGHVSLISLFGWLSADVRWRRWFLAAALVFGLGTLLTRAHYTADVMGALLLSHAVASLTLTAAGRFASMSTRRQVSAAPPPAQRVATASLARPASLPTRTPASASTSSDARARR